MVHMKIRLMGRRQVKSATIAPAACECMNQTSALPVPFISSGRPSPPLPDYSLQTFALDRDIRFNY